MPALNKRRIFGTFLWSKWPEKIWLFPNTYDNTSNTLSGSQNSRVSLYLKYLYYKGQCTLLDFFLFHLQLLHYILLQ